MEDRSMASRNKAFTLIELLAVIAIIGILAGIIFTGAEKAIEKAKVSKTRSAIHSLEVALTSFERDMGSFDVDVGTETFPTGSLDNEQERIRLVRILSGREIASDGKFKISLDIREDPRWNGPYFDPKPKELQPKNKVKYRPGQLVDAWGNPLMIRIKHGNWDRHMEHRPDSFEIWSWGDNETDEIEKSGFGDDITNWE
jgi:prepilin-type N-terminal cleavage/methylation domain-containing protein